LRIAEQAWGGNASVGGGILAALIAGATGKLTIVPVLLAGYAGALLAKRTKQRLVTGADTRAGR
jgi:hypothetical protein